MRPLNLTRSQAPASEPVTITQAKSQLKVTCASEDSYIRLLISAARECVEDHIRRSVVEQEWTAEFERFPMFGPLGWFASVVGRDSDRLLELPRGPLVSVTSVEYLDTTNTYRTFEASNYVTDSRRTPPAIQVKDVSGVQSVSLDHPAPVKVVYRAGYSAELIPVKVKLAILMLVNQLFTNRVPVTQGKLEEVPLSYRYLLQNLKLRNI